jgi:hypothetical protein
VNDVRYELEFPEGGDAVVVGNVIEQSATSPNATMLSYAAEAKGVAAGRGRAAHRRWQGLLRAARAGLADLRRRGA